MLIVLVDGRFPASAPTGSSCRSAGRGHRPPPAWTWVSPTRPPPLKQETPAYLHASTHPGLQPHMLSVPSFTHRHHPRSPTDLPKKTYICTHIPTNTMSLGHQPAAAFPRTRDTRISARTFFVDGDVARLHAADAAAAAAAAAAPAPTPAAAAAAAAACG